MKYIAYGSNMSTVQMAARCPDAKLLGTGRIKGYQLAFYVHATVERSQIKNAYVPVAVWDISEADEERLDRYEGAPHYYIKETCTVQMDDGATITGMIYIMHLIRGAAPTRDYYHGILNAYIELGLSSEINKALEPALTRSICQEHKTICR